jgi:hypothetical protein
MFCSEASINEDAIVETREAPIALHGHGSSPTVHKPSGTGTVLFVKWMW